MTSRTRIVPLFIVVVCCACRSLSFVKNLAKGENRRASQNYRSLAAMLHAVIPKTTRLGVSLVKDPRVLAQTEAMWSAREMSGNRAIRLMERPWFIISPNDPRVQHWEAVVAAAMIFISIITPYEVSVLHVDRESGTSIDFSQWTYLRWANSIADLTFFCDMMCALYCASLLNSVSKQSAMNHDPMHFSQAPVLSRLF